MKTLSKILLLFILTATASFVIAQDAWITQEGKITFYSEAPLEDIDATSTKAVAVFNTKNKTVVSRVAINSFQFKNGLMQDHFNDNFMESNKFPLANLRAEIQEDLDFSKPGTYEVTLVGTLEIREIVQEREIKGKVTITNNEIKAKAEFWVPLEDHDIKVPRMLLRNIAEEILVKVNFELVPHTR